MSTLKYKALGRYNTGWTDPRMPQFGKTGFETVTTEVLRDLWLIRFGGRVVNVDAMPSTKTDELNGLARELVARGLVRHEKQYRADLDEARYYYILEKEDGNN